MNIERIATMLRMIEKNLNQARERFESKEAMTDQLRFDAGCMAVFQAINRSLDLADEIIAGKRLQIPGSYSDSFEILMKEKLISKETASGMKELIRYRNLISHEYYELKPEDIKKLLKKLHHLDNFLGEVKKISRQ